MLQRCAIGTLVHTRTYVCTCSGVVGCVSSCGMVRSAWWLLAVLAFLSGTRAEDSDVIELGEDTFDDGIADLDIVLVEFYAPW